MTVEKWSAGISTHVQKIHSSWLDASGPFFGFDQQLQFFRCLNNESYILCIMYYVSVLLFCIALAIYVSVTDLFNKLLLWYNPQANDQCPGSFYATKFCETKCIHNYLYS